MWPLSFPLHILTCLCSVNLSSGRVADLGGGTVFPLDGLKLTPKTGMMLLFAYNPDPTGVTQHAACPVLEGTKMTATQWYREGVSHAKNWEAHNDL